MLNSVNGKKESMERVFPIAKKYGAVLVCLCLDESGIPETVEGRLSVAEKIVNTAAQYGIPKKNLVMDALVLTISTGRITRRSRWKPCAESAMRWDFTRCLACPISLLGFPREAVSTRHFLRWR